MGEEWEKFRKKIIHLQDDLGPFSVDFLNRDSFRRFCDNLRSRVEAYRNIWITGYFSETIRGELQNIIKGKYNVRLICPEFAIQSERDRRNLQALKKLADAGAEIKFNNRLHARFLVAHSFTRGLLIIGSFDFNTECIGKERYDAGIRTGHPDLVKSATELFEQIWNEPESIPVEEFIEKTIR
ncbi:MAG: phospholipase D-like domain-containing protein [Candidatus Bathyarchaeota archaeon]|jgi:hypothetical protein